MKKLLVFCCSLFLISSISAQENRKDNGLKIGDWAHKDDNGYVYAEGTYQDGIKTGPWRYYVSPVNRYTHVPDVSGSYDALGQKTGNWLFISTKTRIQVQAEFVANLMQGSCTWYNIEGDVMATGAMDAGIRHGQWYLYSQGKIKTRGFYRNGLKIGDWAYDYYPEDDLHVKGLLNFDKGAKSGRLEFYKVDHHPKFGTKELLSGIGQYINGKKVGRWIEYEQALTGELIEAGLYSRQGKRQGVWRTTLNQKNHCIALYENGIKQGAYKQFHDNGKLQYETVYQNDAPIGAFTRYYNNGFVEEKGTTVFIPNTGNLKRDTVYMELALPYEYHFQLVEEPNFYRLNHNYIDWINNPNYSIEPAELDRRYKIYLDYGLEPQRRISRLVVNDKKAVRKGAYKAFFKNGKLKTEGEYYPAVTEVYDSETKTNIRDFARTGKWLNYDDNGYVMRTIFYDKGNLLRMLDDKGNEIGLGTDPDAEISTSNEPKQQPTPSNSNIEETPVEAPAPSNSNVEKTPAEAPAPSNSNVEETPVEAPAPKPKKKKRRVEIIRHN